MIIFFGYGHLFFIASSLRRIPFIGKPAGIFSPVIFKVQADLKNVLEDQRLLLSVKNDEVENAQ